MNMPHRDPHQSGNSNGAVTRAVLESRFRDPSCPHGALYLAAMAELSSEPLAGKHVLHYSSGTAELGIWMATEFAEVHLLDASPSNIAIGLDRAQASGVARRVKAIHLTNPADLDMFADSAFDLVFTRTPLAEIAATPTVFDEITRILKPGARLVLTGEQTHDPRQLESVQRLFGDVQVVPVNGRKRWLPFLKPATGRLIVAWK